MSFDIIKFLEENKIDYASDGKNCAQGNVVIKCPWCSDDPSKHLGIRVNGKFAYGCWRNPMHRGTKPYKLVAKLLNVSNKKAKEIVGNIIDYKVDDFMDVINSLKGYANKEIEDNNVTPIRLYKLQNNTLMGKIVFGYLETRINNEIDIYEFIDMFNLCYSDGKGAYRVFMPVKFGGKFVSFVGRSVSDSKMPRYLSGSKKFGVGNLKDYIYEHDDKSDFLFITEGPFDMMRFHYLLKKNNINADATCLFGINASKKQKIIIDELSKKYKKIFILFDDGFDMTAAQLKLSLTCDNVFVSKIPNGYKDPGELDTKGVYEIIQSVGL